MKSLSLSGIWLRWSFGTSTFRQQEQEDVGKCPAVVLLTCYKRRYQDTMC